MKDLKWIVAFLLLAGTIQAQTCHESGSDVHGMPPIGIMNGHTHGKGHWMASYRFMSMNMDGVSSQGADLTTEDVLNDYMMAPKTMRMDMHMLGVMYAPVDRLTFGVMANYNTSIMNMESASSHNMEMGEHHHHESGMDDMGSSKQSYVVSEMKNEGLGDMKISGLYRIWVNPTHCLHSIMGVKIPTGSVDAGDQMHPIYPYSMQNGTGALSTYLGLNYSWLIPKYLVGAQAITSIPLYENKRGYMAPFTHEVNVWGARKWTRWMSTSVRVRGYYQSAIRGSDAMISFTMSPLGNPANLEQRMVEAMGGINFMPFDQWRIAVEAGVPAYQWNKGVAMNRQWAAIAGLQYMMH